MARKRSDVTLAVTETAAENEATVSELSLRERVLKIAAQLDETFIGRTDAIRAIILAHMAGEHYLLVGDPGTAKSAIATALAKHIVGAQTFKITLGSFTTPEAVFGPLDIEEFTVRKRYKHCTTGMAPEADLAMFDECFKGSDGLINSFLTLLNEREFAGEKTPLHTCGMATNWPELESRSDNVKALYDRALLRVAVEELSERSDVVKMLRSIDTVRSYEPSTFITMAELRSISDQARAIPISDDVLGLLAEVRTRLAFKKDSSGTLRPNIAISSRRLGQLQHVLRVAAWLADESEVSVEHFSVLRFGLWNDRKDIETVEAVLASVDQETVKRIVSIVDKGRDAAAQVRRDGKSPAAINRATQVIKTASLEARSEYNKPILTKAGRELVKKAMHSLREDFDKMMEYAGLSPAK